MTNTNEHKDNYKSSVVKAAMANYCFSNTLLFSELGFASCHIYHLVMYCVYHSLKWYKILFP